MLVTSCICGSCGSVRGACEVSVCVAVEAIVQPKLKMTAVSMVILCCDGFSTLSACDVERFCK